MNELEKSLKDQYSRFEDLLKSTRNINKADPNLLNSLKVHTENGIQNIKSIASIVGSSDGNRTLKVTPFNSNDIKAIGKALWETELGNVTESKTEIMLVLHPITKDYKDKILADIKKKSEDIKVRIRQLRQDFLNNIKALKSEDEKKKKQKDVQILVDKFINQIEDSLKILVKKGI